MDDQWQGNRLQRDQWRSELETDWQREIGTKCEAADRSAAREREALARHVFRMLRGGKKVQAVLLRSGRVWIGATDDRSAQKILADHPGGLIGVYAQGADWRALLDDLEEAGL